MRPTSAARLLTPGPRRLDRCACRSCASRAMAARTHSIRTRAAGWRSACSPSCCQNRRGWSCFGRPSRASRRRFVQRHGGARRRPARRARPPSNTWPGDGLHYEPRWFKPWPDRRSAAGSNLPGRRCPIGDLLFEVGGVRLGFEICEDAWVAEPPRPSTMPSWRSIFCSTPAPATLPSASGHAEAIRGRSVAEPRGRPMSIAISWATKRAASSTTARRLIATCGQTVASGPRLAICPGRRHGGDHRHRRHPHAPRAIGELPAGGH